MARYEVLVEVSLRPGIADPQGATIERALPALGFDGIDSVRVFYHNGHSTTKDNGHFIASLGRKWDNTFQANSTRMSPGDERLRYLFWASCNSVRMSGGHNPWRTWNEANKGLRMIFGFDSVSWDEPGYASGYFREWNSGKSFRRWLA